MWLGVGRQQDKQREETGLTMREKQPGLGSSRYPRAWMLALETKPDEVPDGAKDKKRMQSGGSPRNKTPKAGCPPAGRKSKRLRKRSNPPACGRVDEERICRTFVTRKKGKQERRLGPQEQAAPILRGPGQPKKALDH